MDKQGLTPIAINSSHCKMQIRYIFPVFILPDSGGIQTHAVAQVQSGPI